MSGHGHVIPNADGRRARCGGPSICSECAAELVRVSSNIQTHIDAKCTHHVRCHCRCHIEDHVKVSHIMPCCHSCENCGQEHVIDPVNSREPNVQ